MSNKKKTIRKKRRAFSRALLLMAFAAFLFYDSRSRLVTTEYEVIYAHLPDSFDGFRIVVLSDIHAAVFGKNNEKLVAKIKEAKPDIIAITGDFTDGTEILPLEKQLAIAEALVADIVQIAPVYYVTGNHEWDEGGVWELLPMLEEHGVTILRNRYIRLESGADSILLAGTDDPNGLADMMRPDELVRRIYEREGESFIVMLEHRNNNLPLYSELGVELVLCGHAHGGIIRLPFTDGLIGQSREWFPTYTNGLYSMKDTNMIVSRGIGNHTGLPRFLNNPHIVIAVLRSMS